MKKGVKIALIVLAAFGALVLADVIASVIYKKVNERTETHELKQSFTSIKVDVATSDVEFVKTKKGYGKVVCKETNQHRHTVKVEDGTLKITFDHKYKFNFLMFSPDYKVLVYIPATAQYEFDANSTTGDLYVGAGFTFSNAKIKGSTGERVVLANVKNKVEIESSTGGIHLSKMKPASINVETSTGDLYVTDVTCSGDIYAKSSTGQKLFENVKANNLTVEASTGKLISKKVILSNKLISKSSTGDVKIQYSDAKEIDIKTTTGDVDVEFLTSKIVYAKTTTGEMNVPKSTKGGLCSIETTTGDIKVTIAK